MWKATDVPHLPALVACLLSITAPEIPAAEPVVLRVLLNTQDLGDHFLSVTDSGDALFTTDGLRKLGLETLAENREVEVDGKLYVPLSALAPDVTFRIDETDATVHISADPRFLGTSEFDFSLYRTHDVIRSAHDSGFANYGIFYDLNDDLNFSSISIPAEVGLNISGRLLYSSFSYRKSDIDEKFVRLMSNFTSDNTSAQRRVIVGDFSAYSGQLGGGGIFGGLSIAKAFSITPRFVSTPELNLSGVIETPSEVDIYVDNRLIETRRLPPGGFEFLNLPNSRGSGVVTLVVRDAFGRESVQENPFYLSTALLKAGLHEYSYNLGFRRRDFGTESFDYGELAFLGFHRVGVTDQLTAGLRGEASGDVQNLGANLAFATDGFGELGMVVAASRDNANSGYGGGLSYAYRGSNFSHRLAVRGFSRDYSTLNLSSESDKVRLAGAISLGYSPILSGSVSMQMSAADNYIGQDTKRVSMSYTRRVFGTTTFFLRASRTETIEVSDEIFAGFSLPIGTGRSMGMDILTQDDLRAARAYLSKNAQASIGSDYRLQANILDDPVMGKTTNSNASLAYRGAKGVLSADFRSMDGRNLYRLGISGSAALIDRSFYLSRPIRDSFALVRVGDIQGVTVMQSNRKTGVTNHNGEAFSPDLISYVDHRMSFDDAGIPVNYEIAEIARHVATPLRGGTVVSFAVTKLQAFVGRLLVLTADGRLPAEYWGLELTLPERKTEIVVGRNAEFYLENIPPGEWPARLFLGETECRFSIAIPESEDMIVDMGEISCEVE